MELEQEQKFEKIQSFLRLNINNVFTELGNNSDIVKREFSLYKNSTIKAAFFYVDGLVNEEVVEKTILTPMIDRSYKLESTSEIKGEALIETIYEQLISTPSVAIVNTINEGIDGILSGDTFLLVDTCDQGFILSTKGWASRGIDAPETEPVIRGPRDGFSENIRTNTSLVRRRIRDTNFNIDALKIGKRSRTDVGVGYIEGIVNEGLVKEVKDRLNRIDIDAVLESGYIEELISDAPLSPFVTIQSTERPDKVAASLYEGRVAIFVDNTPFVLLAPAHFWQFLQASDDYYNNYLMGTFFRLIRYSAFIISLTLPSIYVMLASFHQEMIPTPLAVAIAAGREAIPFPVLLEAIIMEIAFELMREAGLRMPKPIGQAVSIVGSLIIGQAAVEAGLVSPIMVIVVATTGIAAFSIPHYDASYSIRLLRFPILLASGTLGLLGFSAVITLLALHAFSLRSFGEAYLSPIIPMNPTDQKDTILRIPWWGNKKRPESARGDTTRVGEHQKPSPSGNETTEKNEESQENDK
ncbi:spore germination protein [Evansella sp. AB-P1]|uniref:spore germination protein n=1 Tax=Evansella sp. AB-P1 TaxID=3037653 RepID=UPI00241EF9CE|nr:spore germination protein [Evansella sp. AB-P1]MDG5789949.1 spore germination protein [Evansella sp. AB-P1]